MSNTDTTAVADKPALPAYPEAHLAASSPQQLIELLIRDEDRAPLNLIEACAQRGGDMVELLRGIYDEIHDWNKQPGYWWLKLHATSVLGLMPTEAAGLLLIEHMRCMSVDDDENLQQWLAGLWPALFMNKPAAVQPALRALASDKTLDWYIRHEAMVAFAAHTHRYDLPAFDGVLAWIASIAANKSESKDMRFFSANLLIDFPRPQFRPLLNQLIRLQNKQWPVFSPDDVETRYAIGTDEPPWLSHAKNPWNVYAPEAIRARQERWAEEDAKERAREQRRMEQGEALAEIPQPIMHAQPKVGRNDPCPCGSGKKYKKCCLNH